MQDESLPQMDPEPEMGAAAAEAAVYDTSPPPLHQNPLILLGQSALDIILQAINEIKENARQMEDRMNGNGIACSLGLVARRCARAEWRQRLRLWRDKCRVAAVVANGTVPGLHSRARFVRAVPRTRPPRARLRE